MTDRERERLARASLARLTEPGDPRLSSIVAELGAVRVQAQLAADPLLREVSDDASARRAADDPEGDLDRARRMGIRFVIPGDDEWPASLDALATAEPLHNRGGVPLGLWVKGPLSLADAGPAVAVVGSRSATSYGADAAAEIGATAARAGVWVVSGAAFGIDQAAHRGALAVHGPTVAVLACGVDRAYPAAHKSLLELIGDVGAVVSEVPPGWSPTRLRFLARNRLIAALGCGTVVVEAAVRSGALNTANWTERLLRPVMGVPGPITSASSQGVHQLIRSGAAILVTSGAEVLEQVGAAGEHLAMVPRAAPRRRDRLSLRQLQVLDAVPVARSAATDSIARTAGIGLVEARSTLDRLHRLGLVRFSDAGWRLATATHDEDDLPEPDGDAGLRSPS